MKFGDYLKQMRGERGWTQPEAAARAQIEQSYLSKLENGKSTPSGETYQRLVEAYGIDARDMAGRLFPAELDRLREIDTLRNLALERSREDLRTPRRFLVAGIAALTIGGGLVGLANVEGARTLRQFTYQSQGVIAQGSAQDGTAAPGAAGGQEQTRFLTRMRGPMFSEQVPGGRRIWRLVGSNDVEQAPRFRWALVPGIALIVGGLGCFAAVRRWR